jgi:hypothetical protein
MGLCKFELYSAVRVIKLSGGLLKWCSRDKDLAKKKRFLENVGTVVQLALAEGHIAGTQGDPLLETGVGHYYGIYRSNTPVGVDYYHSISSDLAIVESLNSRYFEDDSIHKVVPLTLVFGPNLKVLFPNLSLPDSP